jgi:acetyltransferase-like isoleucine patch superfamily enzyme
MVESSAKSVTSKSKEILIKYKFKMEILSIDSTCQSLKNVRVGKNVRISNFINAYECTIDDGTKIGAFVEIQRGATIGKNCKISSHTFICEGVHIEDNVFIGHNVTFINDRYPRSTNSDGTMQTDSDWKVEETFIRKGVSVGSGSTILCGLTIGENAMVGAGSVVTKNIAPNTIVAGNPAKFVRTI